MKAKLLFLILYFLPLSIKSQSDDLYFDPINDEIILINNYRYVNYGYHPINFNFYRPYFGIDAFMFRPFFYRDFMFFNGYYDFWFGNSIFDYWYHQPFVNNWWYFNHSPNFFIYNRITTNFNNRQTYQGPRSYSQSYVRSNNSNTPNNTPRRSIQNNNRGNSQYRQTNSKSFESRRQNSYVVPKRQYNTPNTQTTRQNTYVEPRRQYNTPKTQGSQIMRQNRQEIRVPVNSGRSFNNTPRTTNGNFTRTRNIP